jgi:hypothetical protein
MTKRQFVVLAFRLFALYLLFNLVSQLGYLVDGLSMVLLDGGSMGTMYLAAAVSICISLSVIALLWRKSEWLMQKIFAIPALSDKTIEVVPELDSTNEAEDTTEKPANSFEIMDYYETPISNESLELIAISIIGIWAVLTYAPRLSDDIVFVVESVGSHATVYNTFRDFWRSITALFVGVAEVGLGVRLFLRPWQFQGWIEKFKPKGDADEDESDPKLSS